MGCCCSVTASAKNGAFSKKGAGVELVAVIYISRMVNGYFDHTQQLDALVRYAGANNSRLGLSGYLLVAPPFFLQRLEGPEAAVTRLVNGIKGDHRHNNFMVVHQGPIARRVCSAWSMRPITSSNSSEAFDAVAFILQAISRTLSVASRTLHPKFFNALLSGTDFDLRDEVQDMIVVTISLGRSVVSIERNQAMSADVAFLGAFGNKLHSHLCSLNPDKGSVVLFGGTVVQVMIPWIKGSHNLANKVVRACTELLLGQWDVAARRLRCIVDCGKVRVAHLSGDDTHRKGRYMYGDLLADGVQAAKDFLDSPHLLLVSHQVRDYMQTEFVTTNVPGGNGKLAVVDFPHKIKTWQHSQNGRVASSPVAPTGERAVAILTNTKSPVRETKEKQEIEDLAESWEDLADLEWMYNLENLSNAYQKSVLRKKPSRADVMHRQARPSSFSERSSNENVLLNVIYTSEASRGYDPSPADIQAIGQASSVNNAQRDVTGYLLYTKPYFVQYLEGPPQQVKNLFAKLRRDWRHCNVTLVVSSTIRDGRRSYPNWSMQTTDMSDLSLNSSQNAPLQELLTLMTGHFNNLNAWLPRMHHDLLLSSTHLAVGAHAQCALVAFAVIQPAAGKLPAPSKAPLVNALVPFLDQGGEIAGFLGNHLIGYAFETSIEMLVDQAAELCADFGVNVGIAKGVMLAVNCSAEHDEPDVQFYGDLFQRAQERADHAAKLSAQIVADETCAAQVPSVIWVQKDDVLVGRVCLEPMASDPMAEGSISIEKLSLSSSSRLLSPSHSAVPGC